MMREETPKRKAKKKPSIDRPLCYAKHPIWNGVHCRRDKNHEGYHSFRTSWE